MRSGLKFCSIEQTLAVIGGKWKVTIVTSLAKCDHRFTDLKRQTPGVTQRMLTRQLRELESDGIVHRKVFQQVPPKVEYSLTPYGHSLVPVLEKMAEWGWNHAQNRPSHHDEAHLEGEPLPSQSDDPKREERQAS